VQSNILVGPEAAIGGKSNRRTAPPTFRLARSARRNFQWDLTLSRVALILISLLAFQYAVNE
ncbi:hypothetical protein, partial [Pseudomonas orientalis]|uniref:hypothetical protein n=1 Tax=Pseudomonas orientalis TaxID=76758 RepID=UPI0034D53B89